MTSAQQAWQKLKAPAVARILELEDVAARRGDVIAPRGECVPCDAYRGVIYDGTASCDGCRALWPKLHEVESLVMSWGERQKQPWTPEQLREHARQMDSVKA